MHEIAGLAGEPIEIVLRCGAGLGQDRLEPLPDSRPPHGVEIRLARDDVSRWDRETSRGQLTEVGPLAAH